MIDVVTIRCACGEGLKVAVAAARLRLRAERLYGYGDHVTDARAFVMRWANLFHGWISAGGRLGKTTVTMRCPACRARCSCEAAPSRRRR